MEAIRGSHHTLPYLTDTLSYSSLIKIVDEITQYIYIPNVPGITLYIHIPYVPKPTIFIFVPSVIEALLCIFIPIIIYILVCTMYNYGISLKKRRELIALRRITDEQKKKDNVAKANELKKRKALEQTIKEEEARAKQISEYIKYQLAIDQAMARGAAKAREIIARNRVRNLWK